LTRRRLAGLLVAAWLFGVACGLGYIAVSGGWYEYYFVGSSSVTEDTMTQMVNNEGWQPDRVGFFRRPRLHIP
jgi:hypothetical protein